MREIPRIRLSVERMEHSILAALTEYEATFSEELQRAVKEQCRPENIKRVMDEQVRAVIPDAIRKQIVGYFQYGPGAKAIEKIIGEKLKAGFSWE